MVYEALERKDGFTAVEKDVAGYILANASKVPGMSIAALADAAFCSPATIVRLCQKLGCGGYRQFCLDLSADLQRLRDEGERVDVDHPFASGTGTSEVVESVSSLMRQAIDVCRDQIDPACIEAIARSIRSAQTVIVYAVGESLIAATLFGSLMNKLGVHCVMADQYGERVATTMASGPSDMAIVISYSGHTLTFNHMPECVQILRDRGCKIAFISSVQDDPGFDYVIGIPPLETDLKKISNYYSQTCIHLILNCIYGAVYALDYATYQRHKENVDRLTQMGG